MKLLLDEHFSFRIAQKLRSLGHDVVAVSEMDALGSAGDNEVLAAATKQERVLLTENVDDFMRLHGDWMRPGEVHAGLLLVSPRRFSRSRSTMGALVEALDRHIRAADERSLPSDVQWL